ncbi:DivIVA domain-containing protein [Micromonospora aurantiaca]
MRPKRRNARPPDSAPGGPYRSASYRPLRPGQVRGHSFTTCRRGLDPAEVAAFLDRAAGNLAAAYAEIARSRDESARIKGALREWHSRQAPSVRDLAGRP